MVTAEELVRILAVIQESNELSRTPMKDLLETVVKKDNSGNKWSDTEHYKHITNFNGKSEA